MKLNEHKLRLTGVANLSKELELTKSYELNIKNAEVRGTQDYPNDDETFNRVYKLTISAMSEIEIKNEKQIIKAQKKGTPSQTLFKILYRLWEQEFQGLMTSDEFYQQEMSRTINCYKDQLK